MGVPKESTEQIKFAMHLDHFHPDILYFAIPNGGSRNPREAIRLKNEGVKAGVCDLFISEPVGEFHGFYIEMKRRKGSSTSKEQIQFMKRAKARNYAVCLAKGYDEAKENFEIYMDGWWMNAN